MAGKVGYIGPQMARVVTEGDWERLGAGGQPEAAWGPGNNWELPKGRFSDEALAVLRARPKEFVVSD